MTPPSGTSLEARVGGILNQVLPYLKTDGLTCRLVRIQDGIVFIALEGPIRGCATAAMTVRLGIERRIMEELPDAVRGVELES